MAHSHTILLLFTVLCAGQLALCQDCSTSQGQLQFLEENAKSNGDCYDPLIKLTTTNLSLTVDDIDAICQKDCVQNVVDFLTSTEKCRNDINVKQMASDLKNIFCSFEKGIEDPSSSCFFYDIDKDSHFIGETTTSCAGWWIGSSSRTSSTCPELVPGVNTTETCEDVLKRTYAEVGCCYINYFTTDSALLYITQSFREEAIAAGASVDDLPSSVDITDPDLLEACGITDGDSCPSTVEDDSETESAVIPVVTPLVVLLAALLSGVAV